jgi:hypothetical protein
MNGEINKLIEYICLITELKMNDNNYDEEDYNDDFPASLGDQY